MTLPGADASPTRTGWAARFASRRVSSRLPDFPWDKLDDVRATACAHPDGVCDFSAGTPVDPTPELVRTALAQASDAPGYPTTIGSPEVRQAAVDWLARRFGVGGLGIAGVLPVIGSKELIAGLPTWLGLGPGDTVTYPTLAYPTYEVGARLAGCDVAVADSTVAFGPRPPALLWLNSPSNPTGKILPVEHLAKVVSWARSRGVLVVSDECYLECCWEGEAVSILHPSVCGGSFEGLLTVHSLSKRSNMAGYRTAFLAGDPLLVAEVLAVRKNLGLMVPVPQQQAMAVALSDDGHVEQQHAVYSRRRAVLKSALEHAGFRIDDSQGSLYLWATRDKSCWDTVAWLAERGILVAPGDFYGAAGGAHVRVAFTATDERVAAAATRL